MPSPQEAASILRSAMDSGFDPVKLAGLRDKRKRDLEDQLIADEAAAANPGEHYVQGEPGRRASNASSMNADVIRTRGLLGQVTRDMADDPDTGDAAHDRNAQIQAQLDKAAMSKRPEILDANKVEAEKNAFATFMQQREGNRGKFAAEVSPEGVAAQDADSRRKQSENIALGQGRALGRSTGQPSGPSPYSIEHNSRSRTAVDELLQKVNPNTVGLIGTIAGRVPGTAATDFAAQLKSLSSNLAFNELTQMREASKTGGALGAISERELQLLESTLGALDTKQSPENFKSQLEKIGASLDRWREAQGLPATPTAAPSRITDPNWGR